MFRSIIVVYPYILIERPEDKTVIIRKFHPPVTDLHQFNPYAFASIIGIIPTQLIVANDFFYKVPKFNMEELSNKIKRLEKLKIFT
jgi:hypothetical protein